jgi:hypothetical protein
VGKVWVIEDSGHNYAGALQFGEIEILCNNDYPFTDSSAQNKVIFDLNKKLRLFDPNTDRLLLIGDPILIGICFSLLTHYTRVIPVLKWDRKRRVYLPTTLIL